MQSPEIAIPHKHIQEGCSHTRNPRRSPGMLWDWMSVRMKMWDVDRETFERTLAVVVTRSHGSSVPLDSNW